jgi:2-C-methyl-D-erythritol 4-phosphate cytidylyltransferase
MMNSPPPLQATRFWALIPCAGTGSRALNASVTGPKQYQDLAGRPMVMHTLAAFEGVSRLRATLVVVASGDDFWAQHEGLAAKQQNTSLLIAACGGPTRALSVLNGLEHLRVQGARDDDWVLVHDAARCLITSAQINQLMDACLDDAVGGLLALPLPDTLKQEGHQEGQQAGSGRVAATIDRTDKWLAQTPQMFRLGLLRQAMAQAGDQVTDESSAIEALGLSPRLVKGSAQNFKVTYPEDFALASAVLAGRQKDEK